MLATPSIQGGGGIEVQVQSGLPETPYQKVKQKLKRGIPDQGSCVSLLSLNEIWRSEDSL